MDRRDENIYAFADFRLIPGEGLLLHNGDQVPLPPKAFSTLVVLVEQHGHLVEKTELIERIWENAFVEEAAVSRCVWDIRNALGEDPKKKTFIQTVPRRGYRFVAPVKVQTSGNEHDDRVTFAPALSPPVRQGRSAFLYRFAWFLIPIALVSIALVGYVVVGSRNSGVRGLDPSAPVLIAPIQTQKLSTDGTVHHAVVSRDGKNVVYTNRNRGRQSVWLRELETSSSIEIIPPSDDFYGGLSLSPDGRFLYFTRVPRGGEGQLDVYRVSIFGGIPSKVISETQGWIDVSEDGKKISFVRCYYRDDDYCSLWIANAEDGTDETRLVVRAAPIRIGANRISPDGKTVAFAVGQSENQSNEFSLMAVDLETRVEGKLTPEPFYNIKAIAWLPNLTGVLFTASKVPDPRCRIWAVSSASGSTTPLTADSENYASLSLDSEAKLVVATRVDQDFRLNLYQTQDPSKPPQVLADAFGIGFAKDGKIAFSSLASGNNEIWSIRDDGRDRKQLTNDEADDRAPVFSPGGDAIYFSSNRSGETQIWRMKADGSLQTQLHTDEGGFPTFVSPDGAWLYYLSGRQRSLRRVSTDGGGDQLVADVKLNRVAFAPDGTKLVYPETVGDKRNLVVISIPGGRVVARYNVADVKNRLTALQWSPDGKDLAYILADPDMEKNGVWFMSLNSGVARRVADLGPGELTEQAGFALSADGQRFAVGMGGWKHDAVLFTGFR